MTLFNAIVQNPQAVYAGGEAAGESRGKAATIHRSSGAAVV
jgi:hypothetical protein